MNIIFLDFDGVLNSAQEAIWHHRFYEEKNWLWGKVGGLWYWLFHKRYGKDWSLYYYFKWFSKHLDFCPISCSNVQYIMDKCPDTYIVVSSVWRSWGLKYLSKILKINGIDHTRLIDITPTKGTKCSCEKEDDGRTHCGRGHQIDAWMLNNYKESLVDNYVIIDDDSDMLDCQMKNFVQTDSYHGLNYRQAQKAIEILKGEE